MEYEKPINFSDDIFNDTSIELTLFSPVSDDVGVIVVSSKENNAHTLRIIQLLYSPQDESYSPIQELAAFSFQTYKQLEDFLEKLPNISGIDMLLLLNPLRNNSSFQN